MGNGADDFDVAAYKSEILSQSEEASTGWQQWRQSVEAWLDSPTESMLDMAAVSRDGKVLDVAAGTGGDAIRAAQRVGPGGQVIAVDLSPAMLTHAVENARAASLGNLEFVEMDAESLALQEGSFDAVISRIGLTYFPDLTGTLRRFHVALRIGGSPAGIVYSRAEANGFLSLPLSVLEDHGLFVPTEGRPGPFSLSNPDVLRTALLDAGFGDVQVRTVEAPLGMASVAECVRFVKDCFVGLHRMMGSLPEGRRTALWREIEVAFEAFTRVDGVFLPCELLVASGQKTADR